MFKISRKVFAAIVASGLAAPAMAADYEPPVVEAPVYQAPSGWYIRGDLDYHWSDFRGADYITYGEFPSTGHFSSGDLDGAMSLGAGVGYQINDYFRADLTGDYWFDSDFEGSTRGYCGDGFPCTSKDTSSYNAFVLLANAYVDIGTWNRITPYVGAGIGGAHVEWDTLKNTDRDGTFEHDGNSDWRFAYAVMAGASYCINQNWSFDAGYRFTHINGGEMFKYANGAGPGYDDGFNVNEVRGGLRYQFGGGKPQCGAPEPVVYEPEPLITK